MQNELQGSLVLVNPYLDDDPMQKQGQLGMITDFDLDNDEVYVSFSKGEQGLYSTAVLQVLKPPAEIYKIALVYRVDMDTADFKDLLRITAQQDMNTRASIRNAMEIAMKNETLRTCSLVSIRDSLRIAPEQAHELEAAPTRGR